jgi:hypothetical protein
MKHEQEGYAKSFPSAWLSPANAPPSPAPVPNPKSRTQHSPHSSVSELKNDASSNHGRDSLEDNTIGGSTGSDAGLDPSVEHGNGSSVSTTPRHSADERRGGITKAQDARLAVYKSSRPITETRAVSVPAIGYSTVYPASWTIARAQDVPRPSPAAVMPACESSSKPETIAATAMTSNGSTRLISTASLGDVAPVSPMRRRLQRDFQSMSQPSPPPRKLDSRAMSVDTSKSSRMQRLLGTKSYMTTYPQRPVQSVVGTRPDTPGRHESSTSNYSTIQQASAPSQSDDAPANHRITSAAYSRYGSDD